MNKKWFHLHKSRHVNWPVTFGLIGLLVVTVGTVITIYLVRNKVDRHEEFDATKDLFI
ncbi:hypothetical protein BXY57_2117 [Thermoflavifilum aggregans]|uniref:Uncharacterized protein n=2 Tax=Thermoflavifilum TaxID=1649506 RepID=A0A1I7NF30_9BACT|nr:hypothetical protein BXY57_2117 [Thermoflavifilum aggregans]SFV33287.1 hypothetical protein SAMN05660895_1616 [Thermoflavifilum thermophilum]